MSPHSNAAQTAEQVRTSIKGTIENAWAAAVADIRDITTLTMTSVTKRLTDGNTRLAALCLKDLGKELSLRLNGSTIIGKEALESLDEDAGRIRRVRLDTLLDVVAAVVKAEAMQQHIPPIVAVAEFMSRFWMASAASCHSGSR